MLDLDPRRLETFRVVATLGKVSSAARALHLSQPAVTAQIRQLEDGCGAPLFVRSARGMALNDRGRALLHYAQRIRQSLDEAATSVMEDARPGGELLLAASTTIAAYVLPRLLVAYLRANGGGVRMEVGNTAQVLEWVKEGRTPLGLVEGHARAAGLHLSRFLADELLPVVAAEAPPLFAKLRRLSDLSRVPLIWREPGSGTRAVVERALKRAGSTRRSRHGDLQLGSTEAIKTAVLLGAGIGFLSRCSIRRELHIGALRPLTIAGLRIERDFSFVLPSRELSGPAARFVRFARETPLAAD